MWILRLLFPGRLVVATLLLLAGTGLWLRVGTGSQASADGPVQLLHSAAGWFGIVACLSWLAHQGTRCWGSLSGPKRLMAVGLGMATAVALATGLWLFFPGAGGAPAWARPVHMGATLVLSALLVPAVLSANCTGSGG